MRSQYKLCVALCVLAVCAAGVWADAETNTHQKPGNSMPQKNVTLQLIGYTAKGTVPEGTEQVSHPACSSNPRQQILRGRLAYLYARDNVNHTNMLNCIKG